MADVTLRIKRIALYVALAPQVAGDISDMHVEVDKVMLDVDSLGLTRPAPRADDYWTSRQQDLAQWPTVDRRDLWDSGMSPAKRRCLTRADDAWGP